MRERLKLGRLKAQALNREIMVGRIDWMKGADNSILQVLGPPLRLELTTGDIAWNADISSEYTSSRLSELVDHNMVSRIEVEGSYNRYKITDLGVRYLRGEADVTELRDDTEE